MKMLGRNQGKTRSTTSNPPNTTWQNRADLSIAHGALTNSKRPGCFVRNVYPTHLVRGAGAQVWDDKGKPYVDFICGLGSMIIGHGHHEIADAMYYRARNGATLSLGTTVEVEAAEKVKEIFPFIDRLRFLKTGTDATLAALRIARTATGRAKVLKPKESYHGWGDEFVSLTPPALGIYGAYNIEHFEELSEIDHDTAAVILEPVNLDASRERVEYLKALRQRCTEVGAVLIFDEIITGFRTPKMCVSNRHGIAPDLICLGKAMANGMPISVVGGRGDVMEAGQWFVSSTFAGETLSLAAAVKTMTLLQTKFDMEWLWAKGEQFQKEFNALHPGIKLVGYPTRAVFRCESDELKALFWQEAVRAGLLFGSSFFFSFPHVEHTEMALNICSDVVTKLKTKKVTLEGELPQTPFAAKARQS